MSSRAKRKDESIPSSVKPSFTSMSPARQRVLRMLFGHLDKDGMESCKEKDIRGLMNKDEVKAFLKHFDKKEGDTDGKIVSYLEFAEYYWKIGGNMKYNGFIDILERDWPYWEYPARGQADDQAHGDSPQAHWCGSPDPKIPRKDDTAHNL